MGRAVERRTVGRDVPGTDLGDAGDVDGIAPIGRTSHPGHVAGQHDEWRGEAARRRTGDARGLARPDRRLRAADRQQQPTPEQRTHQEHRQPGVWSTPPNGRTAVRPSPAGTEASGARALAVQRGGRARPQIARWLGWRQAAQQGTVGGVGRGGRGTGWTAGQVVPKPVRVGRRQLAIESIRGEQAGALVRIERIVVTPVHHGLVPCRPVRSSGSPGCVGPAPARRAASASAASSTACSAANA